MTSTNTSIYQESCKIIPGGVNSPVRSLRHLKMQPLIARSGSADTITDEDGVNYIDYCGSWGSLILGHAHEKIVHGVREQVSLGSSFGIATEIEFLLAKKVLQHMSGIDQIRFVSSGTEATMSAVRLARGYTGKPKFVKFHFHYHGHGDGFLVKAGSGVTGLGEDSSSAGIPKEIISQTISLPFNDMQTCLEFFCNPDNTADIAAVILEPIAANMGVVPATQEFMQMLRDVTHKIGALLIFDEVVTGFRVGLEGASKVYGITPDLYCLGKVIGGGFPAAAFGGKKEIMEYLAPLGSVYQAGTLSGNPIAMRAGYIALQEVSKPGFYEELQSKTDLLLKPVEEAIYKSSYPITLNRIGSMFTIFFGLESVSISSDIPKIDTAVFREFFKFMLEKGIYISPSAFEACFVSMAHSEAHLKKTSAAIIEFIATLHKTDAEKEVLCAVC